MYLRNHRRLYSEQESSKNRRTIKIIYLDTRYDEDTEKIWKNVKRRIARENRVGWIEDDIKYMVLPSRFFGGPVKEQCRRFEL